MKTRKILALVLSLVMIASALPLSGVAVPVPAFVPDRAGEEVYTWEGYQASLSEEMPYTVIVGDVFATYENANDILGDGSVSLDVDGKTLKLKNSSITGTYISGYTYATGISVSDVDEFTIEFEGNNTINVADSAEYQIAGIYSDGTHLILKGKTDNDEENVLTINAGNATSYHEGSYGIIARGDITVESGTINAFAGDAPTYTGGIYAEGYTLNVKGGVVNAVGGNITVGGSSNGIFAKNVVIVGDAVVNATGGESPTSGSYGIQLYGSFWASGTSVVTATGGKGNFSGSAGISVWKDFYVKDTASVTAKGTETSDDSESCGVSLSLYSKEEDGGNTSYHGYKLNIDSTSSVDFEGKDLAVSLFKPVFDDPAGFNDHPNSTQGGVVIDGAASYVLSAIASNGTDVNPDSIDDIDFWDVTKFVLAHVSSYKVSFDANGGAPIDDISVTKGEKYGRLPSSSVAGLSGGDGNWYLVNDDGSVSDTNIKANTVVELSQDHKLFVKRKVLSPNVKITLTVPGALSDSYQYYVPENSTRVLTVTVNNRNDDILDYTYEWFKNGDIIDGETENVLTLDGNVSDSGEYTVKVTAALKEGTAIAVTENTAYTEKAQTVKILHAANTLNFNANGGEDGPVSKYTGGDRIAIPGEEPARDNYTFDGWNTKADGSGVTYFADNEYVFVNDNGNGGCTETLYANWSGNEKHTVTFVTNGGSAVDSVECEDGSTVRKPTNPKKNGYTFKGWYTEAELDNKYDFDTPVTADITLYAKWTKRSGGGGGGGSVTKYTLTYVLEVDGEKHEESYNYGRNVVLTFVPERDGFVFDGWYNDQTFTEKVTQLTIKGDAAVYAGWIQKQEEIKDEDKVPSALDGQKHNSYIFGYPDGTVRPNSFITRSEVSAIFFRLLKEEIRQNNKAQTNSFSDVASDAWYVTELSTLARLGIVQGRTDTLFAPLDFITRAEFAAICARFDDGEYEVTHTFSDISGHWAEQEILKAASRGWIEGYAGGLFSPDSFITRAEAVTMINRVLQRSPKTQDDLHKDMITFSDNSDEFSWYYVAIQEAANSHEYNRNADGSESWTQVNN